MGLGRSGQETDDVSTEFLLVLQVGQDRFVRRNGETVGKDRYAFQRLGGNSDLQQPVFHVARRLREFIDRTVVGDLVACHELDEVFLGHHALFGKLLLVEGDSVVDGVDPRALAVVDDMGMDGDFLAKQHEVLAVFQDIRFKILDRDAAKCATDVLHAVRDNQPVEAAFQFFDAVVQNIAVQRTPAVRAEQVHGNAAQHELAGSQSAVAATREHDQLRILRNLHGCVSSQEMRSELAESRLVRRLR